MKNHSAERITYINKEQLLMVLGQLLPQTHRQLEFYGLVSSRCEVILIIITSAP